jgi:diacylglycerol kinase (ATP)
VRSVLAVTGPRTQRDHVSWFKEAANGLAEFQIIEHPAPEQFAASLKQPTDCVLVFGGDGTLNRYLSTLLDAQIPCIPVPSGSGNDLARAIGIPKEKDAFELFQAFLASQTTPWTTDIASLLTHDENGSPQQQYFACCVNIGLDADAAERANSLPNWLKARGGFFIGGLRAIISGNPGEYQLTFDGQITNNRLWFVAILNTPTYGGGLVIAPQASVTDGSLETVTCDPIPKWKLFHHIPKLLTGKHIREVTHLSYRTVKTISVKTRLPERVYADGEFMGFTPIEASLATKTLPVLRRKSF